MARTKDSAGRRRQWGSDRRTEPLPPVANPAGDSSIALTRFAMFVSLTAWLAYIVFVPVRQLFFVGGGGLRFPIDAVLYALIVTLLTFSAVAYLLAGLGHRHRSRSHLRVPRARIDDFFAGSMPTLTVLVPSYREDVRVVRNTLLSAALQEYPYMRIVLLIDDPPEPDTVHNAALLTGARSLASQIEDLLAEPRARFDTVLVEYEARAASDDDPTVDDMLHLAEHYVTASSWLRDTWEQWEVADHTDEFLTLQVLKRLEEQMMRVASALVAAANDGEKLSKNRLLQLHRSLAWTFRAEITSFERKQYASLSDESNKAMNLNSYLGLMGGSFTEETAPGGKILRPAPPARADLVVPDPDYVLTLDADSVLLPEYCLRLVFLMEQPTFSGVAVAQTPYSAFPGSATRIERIAGATTDLQHYVHQGLTYYGATFWVGANAVLRKRALDDIVEIEYQGGWEIRRYIQDRTVIEDTDSSVDLALSGWTLYNYPERLSYSATPPDFGSLCIQRERWANGGLLIIPRMFRNWREQRARGERGRMAEAFLRLNYMASIAWASLALVVLLFYPFSERLLSWLVVFAAAPYFLIMAGDLKRAGYKRTDVLRIYAFNLLLLPVNLAGAVKSLGQAATGRKIAFARTPKVKDRTTAPLSFVLMPYLLVAFSALTLARDIDNAEWGHAVFAGINALLASYAIVAFVGIRASLVDIWMNSVRHLYADERPSRETPQAEPLGSHQPDWRSVLYYGSDDGSLAAAPDTSGSGPRSRVGAKLSPKERFGEVEIMDGIAHGSASGVLGRRDLGPAAPLAQQVPQIQELLDQLRSIPGYERVVVQLEEGQIQLSFADDGAPDAN